MRDAINQIEDLQLRSRLFDAFERYSIRTTRFGLQYESNTEFRVLWGLNIRVGDNVTESHNSSNVYCVHSIDGGDFTNEEEESFPLRDFVRVATAGEVTYPFLSHVSSVNPDAPVGHRLIEGDNLDALHLLTYSESASYDVIYIDPPYGSGATEWTYNNRFVNTDDTYKNSMWLSMINSRLRMAKKLIKDDGVLIIAIDDFHMHNLRALLEQEWRGWRQHVVAVRHNPSGGQAKGVARLHEYCLFLTKNHSRDFRFLYQNGNQEWNGGYFRRGTGRGNFRHGCPNQFFAILVDDRSIDEDGYLEVVGAEGAIGLEQDF